MNILKRVKLNLERRIRARRLGVSFSKRSSFSMPSHIDLDGKSYPIDFPAGEDCAGMFTELFLDDEYGLEGLRRQNIRTVIDIGANIGLFSILARTFFPSAVIHAYEPNPALEGCLANNGRIFGFQYFLEAVGLHEGRAFLKFEKGSGLTQAISSDNGNVPQASLKKVLERIGGGRGSDKT